MTTVAGREMEMKLKIGPEAGMFQIVGGMEAVRNLDGGETAAEAGQTAEEGGQMVAEGGFLGRMEMVLGMVGWKESTVISAPVCF